MEIENMIGGLEQRAAEAIKPEQGDYIGEEDGLLYCGKCNTPKQTRVEIFGRVRTPMCLCKCEAEKRARAEEERKRIEREARIRSNRAAAFPESDFRNWRFEKDNLSNPKISEVVKKYVKNFAEMKRMGKGLLLYGPVGRGKTFMAACAANALLDSGYSVLMTNFARIANTVFGMSDGKQEHLDSLNRYSLLILDDLAAERKTDYMQEIVFSVIDARYRAGKPVIITTNLTMDEMTKPGNVTEKRIYDRILQMTAPVEVRGSNQRYGIINADYETIKKLLG